VRGLIEQCRALGFVGVGGGRGIHTSHSRERAREEAVVALGAWIVWDGSQNVGAKKREKKRRKKDFLQIVQVGRAQEIPVNRVFGQA
jgi:hypothetical protein